MDTKPSPLFLIILAGLGTALLSPINANGTIFVLAIPFAILATILYTKEDGIMVGVGASAAGALLLQSMEFWDMISYALAAESSF